MSSKIHENPESNLFDAHREKLKADGFCVIENALDTQTLDRALQRFSSQAKAEATINTGQNHANNATGNQWVGMLLNKGGVFFDLIDHSQTTALIATILGDDYTISAFDGHIQRPGAAAMAPHIDQWWLPTPRPAREHLPLAADMRRAQGSATQAELSDRPINAAVVASVMFMLTDFTASNGATRVVPGSHLSGRQPDPAVPWTIDGHAVTAAAGSALVFDGRLWHAAGENRSKQSRMGVLAYYSAPFCRPLENYLTGMHPEAQARCPQPVLERLGYRSWQMYGHTGDLSGTTVATGGDVIGQLGAE